MMLRRRLLFALALAAVAGTGLTAVVASAQPGALRVEQVRFVQADLQNDTLTLQSILYVTSHGGASRDVRIVAYLYPSVNGVAEQRMLSAVGRVASERTQEVTIVLELPDFGAPGRSSRTLDFLVFEDELLTQEGHGSIGYHGERGAFGLAQLAADSSPFEHLR